MAWLSGWTKRKEITLTGGASGAQVDFQLDLAVSYAAAMQGDFDDLRFTQSDGTTLVDAWCEVKVDDTSATVWVEFPTTPANTVEQTYYMYYGKADAVGDWNGYKVFNYFEGYDYWLPEVLYEPSPQVGVGVSTFLELANDDLLVMYISKEFGGANYGIKIRKSTDRGETWSYLSDVIDDTSNRAPNGFFQLSDGTVVAVYSTGWNLDFKTSDDNGATWSAKKDISDTADGDTIVLANGRWLDVSLPSDRASLIAHYSDDNGDTWNSVTIASATNSFEDVSIIQLDNGKILIIVEDEISELGNTTIELYKSTDNGETWSFDQFMYGSIGDSYDYEIGGFVEIGSGTVIALYTTSKYGGSGYRNYPLFMAKSTDCGVTWDYDEHIIKSIYPEPPGGIEQTGIYIDGDFYIFPGAYATFTANKLTKGSLDLDNHGAYWIRDATYTHSKLEYDTTHVYSGTHALHMEQLSAVSGEWGRWHNPTPHTLPFIVEWMMYDDNDATAYDIFELYDGTNLLRSGVYTDESGSYYVYKHGVTWYITSIARSVGWHKFKVIFNATGSATIYIDGSEAATGLTGYSNLDEMRIWNYWAFPSEWWLDNLLIRKYAANPPTYAFGAEESAPTGGNSLWYFNMLKRRNS